MRLHNRIDQHCHPTPIKMNEFRVSQTRTNPHPLWMPYCQMKTAPNPIRVKSARGVILDTDQGPLIDGVSAWWSVIHGYQNPVLDRALAHQSTYMAHSMLGGLVHDPALRLADQIVAQCPAPLAHVFFSDSGSVAMEVALKMAVQFHINQGNTKKNRFGYLEGAYHGDTMGVMGVCDPEEGMHHLFKEAIRCHDKVPIPDHLCQLDAVLSQDDRDEVEKYFRKNHLKWAAFVCEPLVQGAGGFRFYAKEFLKWIETMCRKYKVLLIIDEIATGCGRTGKFLAIEHVPIVPDILTLGKGLTGGYLGHAATVASSQVFDAFYDDDPEKAFMHGPTFMGNPLACSVASASLDVLTSKGYLNNVLRIEKILKERLGKVQHSNVKQTRVFGAFGVIELDDISTIHECQAFAIERGVWIRPFRNVVYIAPAYVMSDDELNQCLDVMIEWVMTT